MSNKEKELNKETSEEKVVEIKKPAKAKADKKAPKNALTKAKADKKDVKKPQKMTFDHLKKENKKLDKKKEMIVKVGDSDYVIEYDAVFRPSKQQKVLDDVLKFYERVDEEGIEILDLATPYFVLLIVKHFTSLEVPDDIEEAMLFLNVLLDLEILNEILNMLPEKEVEKVNTLLTDAMTIFQENLEEVEKELAEMVKQNKIENKEILGLNDIEEEVDLTEYPLDEESDKPIN